MDSPRTYSITKYRRPSGVVPASKTLAIAGWSISASAWRSASNRATTRADVHPGLDDLDRDLAVDGLDLFGQPDLAHASLAQALEETIGAEVARRGRKGRRCAGDFGLAEVRKWLVGQSARMLTRHPLTLRLRVSWSEFERPASRGRS